MAQNVKGKLVPKLMLDLHLWRWRNNVVCVHWALVLNAL